MTRSLDSGTAEVSEPLMPTYNEADGQKGPLTVTERERGRLVDLQ